MRLVVDAVAVRPGSAAIVIGNVIRAWAQLAPEDEITVLADGEPDFLMPESVSLRTITNRSGSALERTRAQSFGIRRACRQLRADALLSAVTASAFVGAPCPHGVILYDLRHEVRPEQFSSARRQLRGLLYGWSFLRADALFCISERTRRDLLTRRPSLRDKAHVALLGADHASGWQPDTSPSRPYVLAFGHFPNKNVDGVLAAWSHYAHERAEETLRICGLGPEERVRAQERVRALDLGDRVELLPWLDDRAFESVFAGAAAVLFPSDFEGFGLPAVEALVLGVPVVVSADPALLEVTGGHAVVAADDGPDELAAALARALALSADEIDAGVRHARSYTWRRTAAEIRSVLVRLAGQPQIPVSSR